MPKELTDKKKRKRKLAAEVKDKAYELLNYLCLSHKLSVEETGVWFDRLLRCRSLNDVDNAKSILETLNVVLEVNKRASSQDEQEIRRLQTENESLKILLQVKGGISPSELKAYQDTIQGR